MLSPIVSTWEPLFHLHLLFHVHKERPTMMYSYSTRSSILQYASPKKIETEMMATSILHCVLLANLDRKFNDRYGGHIQRMNFVISNPYRHKRCI